MLQASALRDGAVSTVQTILTVELPLTVVLAAAVFHGSLSLRTSGAIAGMTVGLATLLLSADPTPGSEDPSAADWLLTLPVTAGALTILMSWAAGAGTGVVPPCSAWPRAGFSA